MERNTQGQNAVPKGVCVPQNGIENGTERERNISGDTRVERNEERNSRIIFRVPERERNRTPRICERRSHPCLWPMRSYFLQILGGDSFFRPGESVSFVFGPGSSFVHDLTTLDTRHIRHTPIFSEVDVTVCSGIPITVMKGDCLGV